MRACLGWAWEQGVKIRHKIYDRQILPSLHLGVPTVSIGNIAVGGTGKTPFLHMLLNHLDERQKIAVLTRGYRSQLENKVSVAVGSEIAGKAAAYGDEAALTASLFPEVIFGVGKNRWMSGHLALNRGIDLCILEDGFQHRQIHRDHNIVLLSGEDPFEGGHFFPKGYLRDHPERLSAATLIVFAGNAAPEKISPYTRAPWIQVEMEPEPFPLAAKTPVVLASGIAKPDRFEYLVRQKLHLDIVSHLKVRDHSPLSEKALIELCYAGQKEGALALVVTSKDFIKMRNRDLPLPLYEARVSMQVTQGREAWQLFLDQLQQERRRSR